MILHVKMPQKVKILQIHFTETLEQLSVQKHKTCNSPMPRGSALIFLEFREFFPSLGSSLWYFLENICIDHLQIISYKEIKHNKQILQAYKICWKCSKKLVSVVAYRSGNVSTLFSLLILTLLFTILSLIYLVQNSDSTKVQTD